MRVIHKASMVFLLKDIYLKAPVTHAVILCNGKQNPYTRKRDGHYVFSDLYPGKYNVSITCKGYNDLNFLVELKENETKVITSDLSYNAGSSQIMRLTRFEIICKIKNQIMPNALIRLKLKNPISFMKLTETAKAQTDRLKLNMDLLPALLGQKYIYEVKNKKHEIFLWGYNQENKCYVTENFLENDLDPEGTFYPVWDITTDGSGRAVMPLMDAFMKEDMLEFECFSNDFKASFSFNVKNKHQSGEVFYAEAKFLKNKQ